MCVRPGPRRDPRPDPHRQPYGDGAWPALAPGFATDARASAPNLLAVVVLALAAGAGAGAIGALAIVFHTMRFC